MLPDGPDNTKSSKQGSLPSTVIVVKTPDPAGIVAPLNEKPNTVPLPEEPETVKPFAAASPPEADT